MKQIIAFSWKGAAAAVATLFLMQTAGAQTLSEDMQLDQVVVTGTRVPVPQESLATPVTVVSRETIEQKGDNALLPVLSQEVPGMFVNSRGILGYGVSGGASGNISMRGVTGGDGRILMLIDGHPQYATIYGHPVADAYLAGDAERVEVSRGASSVLYGSNAMGGAINIITRRVYEEGNQAHLRAMAGSYGSQQYQLTDSYKHDRLTVFGGGSYSRTDGHRPNSAFESLSAMGKVGYELSDAWRITSHVNLAKFYAENPGPEANPMVEGYADVMRGMSEISLDNRFDRFSGSLNLFYNWGNHFIDDGHTAVAPPQQYVFHSTDYMGGFNLYEAAQLFEGNTLTAGMDMLWYGGNAFRNPETEYYADHKKLYDVAGYVFMQQNLQRLSLNAGVRLDHHELYGNIWIPQAGVSYGINESFYLKLSASKGFRAPNMRELYMFPPHNEELDPEKNWNYDFTISKYFLDNRLSMELDLFYVDGDNMVEVVREDGKPKNRNVGEYTNTGVDYSFKYRINDSWMLHGNYSYLHMEKPIVGSPRNQGYFGLQYRTDCLTVSSGVQVFDDLCLATGANPVCEHAVLWNARVDYKWRPTINVFVKGENLLAQEYATLADQNTGSLFPMPRATFMAGFSVDL